MMTQTREELLEGEWLVVRHSGEIPEVAFHGSLHYLTEDPEGPALALTAAEIRRLEEAALARYQDIILRDLDLDNRDRPLFRGLKRVHHNWFRYVRYCEQVGGADSAFRVQAAQALTRYLVQETEEVRTGVRTASVNCCAGDLRELLQALRIEADEVPSDWPDLCPAAGPEKRG